MQWGGRFGSVVSMPGGMRGKVVLERYSAPLHNIVKWRSAPKRLATVPNKLTYFLKGYSPLSNEAPPWQGDSSWHRLCHSYSTTDSPESLYEWIPSQAFVHILPQGTRRCERLSSIPRTNTQSTFTDLNPVQSLYTAAIEIHLSMASETCHLLPRIHMRIVCTTKTMAAHSCVIAQMAVLLWASL